MAVQIAALNLSCHNCTEVEKKYRGCNGEPEQPYFLDDIQLKRCPLKYIHPNVFQYFQYYKQYKKGFYIFPGNCAATQPAKLLDIFNIIESEEIRIEENKRKK